MTAESSIRKRELLFVFIVVVIAVFSIQSYTHTAIPKADALRYIDYSVSLYKYNVFGLSNGDLESAPQPGSANAPLYPLFINGVMHLQPELFDTLNCYLKNDTSGSTCPESLQTLIIAQNLLVCVMLLSIWFATWILFSSKPIGWVTIIFILLSGQLHGFSNRVLTETLVLFFYSGLYLALVLSLKTCKIRWWSMTSVCMALLTLTRPEYLYLSLFLIAIIAAYTFCKNRSEFYKTTLSMLIIFLMCLSPWLYRNFNLTDEVSITEGYSGVILMQRVAYNRMTWKEWGVSFVYWFPGGNRLSRYIFDETSYDKLSVGADSYYVFGNTVLRDKVYSETSPEDLTAYLIKTEILTQPVKHTLVTIALMWRAIFLATYWGLFGAGCFFLCMVMSHKRKNYLFLISSLPVWFMAVFYAFVSVSIDRYNLGLIFIYAISMAWCIKELTSFLMLKISTTYD